MNNETPVAPVNNDDEIDLRELILTIAKGWKTILISTVVILIVTFVYALHLKDQYVVTTKAATMGSSSSQMSGLAALAGVNMNSSSGNVDLMQHIDVVIKNTFFMDNILGKKWVISQKQTKKERKEKAPIKYDTLTLAQYWDVKPDTTIPDWEYLYKMGLYGRLRSPKLGHITVENTGGILEVKTKFDNPQLSYQVHGVLLHLLKEYLSNDYATRNRESRIFIQQRVGEVKGTLSGIESQLRNLRQSNFIDLAPRIALERARLEREVELQAGVYAELTKQLETAKIEEKKDKPIFEVLQPAELPLGPSEPNRKLLIAIGIVLGIALGIFVVFLKEWIKTFFGTPMEQNQKSH